MITLRDIREATAREFGFTALDMISSRQGDGLSTARQVGMYLARALTAESLPAIGAAFGDRHHTTVLHGIRRIGGIALTDDAVFGSLRRIRRSLADHPIPIISTEIGDWVAGQMGITS